jgi:hypothetical protein
VTDTPSSFWHPEARPDRPAEVLPAKTEAEETEAEETKATETKAGSDEKPEAHAGEDGDDRDRPADDPDEPAPDEEKEDRS